MGQSRMNISVDTCRGGSMASFSSFWCSSFTVTTRWRGCFTMSTFFMRLELTRNWIPNNRIQPLNNVQLATRMLSASDHPECRADTDKSTNRRQDRQHDKWGPH